MGPLLPLILGGAGLLGKLFGGGAQGAAQERGNRNTYGLQANQQALGQYGIQQNALLQALLAQGRDAQSQYGTQQGATTSALGQQSQEATSRYGTRQGAMSNALSQQSQEGLQRAQLGLQAPSVRARQGVLGSLMQNLQPVSVQNTNPRLAGRMPQITGGLTPAALSPETRQQGAALSRQALEAQLSGSDVPGATNFMSGVLDAPRATDFMSGVLKPPPATDYTKGILPPPQMAGYQQPGRGESAMSWLSLILGGAGGVGDLINQRRPSRMDERIG